MEIAIGSIVFGLVCLAIFYFQEKKRKSEVLLKKKRKDQLSLKKGVNYITFTGVENPFRLTPEDKRFKNETKT